MVTDRVLVVGAGAGGLAVAAELRCRGIPVTVLERSDAVGAAWRGRYDRLRLHTTRAFSGLPGLPLPRSAGRWVSRDDVVGYLEAYARHHHVEVRTGVEVTRLERLHDGGWLLRTLDSGTLTAPQVVLATGYSHTPRVPDWPGVETFPGDLVALVPGYRPRCRKRFAWSRRGDGLDARMTDGAPWHIVKLDEPSTGGPRPAPCRPPDRALQLAGRRP